MTIILIIYIYIYSRSSCQILILSLSTFICFLKYDIDIHFLFCGIYATIYIVAIIIFNLYINNNNSSRYTGGIFFDLDEKL